MLFLFMETTKFYVYILFSETLDKFYIGYTSDIEARIKRHNQKSKGFTGQKKDWELKYSETFTSKSEAIAREKQIKNWKSRIKIIELIKQKE